MVLVGAAQRVDLLDDDLVGVATFGFGRGGVTARFGGCGRAVTTVVIIVAPAGGYEQPQSEWYGEEP